MSLFDLTDKVAIVTGSSRGIGRAIALRMAEQGARVVIASRKQEACQAVVDEITSAHGDGRAIAVAANISSKEALCRSSKAFIGIHCICERDDQLSMGANASL